MAHDVFVSYSNKDKTTADALVATLEQHGTRCWVAPRDVPPGTDYAAALVQAINSSSVLVLVFSSSANTSPHVLREIERAASKSIPILPLRIEDVSYSESMEYYISSTHWLDALTPPLQQHLERLARSVAALLEADGGVPRTQTAVRPPGIAPVTLELGPPRVAGPFGARLTATSHDLTLRNSGDESVELQLNADDDEGHCAFSVPDGVTVPPHGATTVTIKVRPRVRRWRGGREIRWFNVMASSGDGGQPPTIVSGQFEDLPYGWVPYGGGAMLGVAVAAVFAVTQLVGGDGDKSIQAVTPTQTSSEAVPPNTNRTLPAVTQMPTPEDTAGASIDVQTATAAVYEAGSIGLFVESADRQKVGERRTCELYYGGICPRTDATLADVGFSQVMGPFPTRGAAMEAVCAEVTNQGSILGVLWGTFRAERYAVGNLSC